MTITKTADVEGTLQQIYALAAAGCDIVRCTCNEQRGGRGAGPDRAPLADPDRSPTSITSTRWRWRRSRPACTGCASTPATSAGPSTSRPSPPRPRPRRADPHRRQRRLARPGAVREVRRRSRPRRWSSRRMQEIAYFDEVGFDLIKISVKASSVPLMVEAYRQLQRGHRPPAPPRRHRGRAAAGRAGQGDGRASPRC